MSVCACIPFYFAIYFWLYFNQLFPSFRMVEDDDDEGALSDSDGHSGLAADDLASK